MHLEIITDPSCITEEQVAVIYASVGIGRLQMQTVDDCFGDLALYADAFFHNAAFFNACGLRSRPVLSACTRGPLKHQVAA